MTPPGSPLASPAAAALLAWYDARARDLPWRRSRDPYRVWVSEVMLQQTRVETVIPYYERFLVRFPDIQRLAAAAEEEVLAAFAGLGYYRRARELRRAAQAVVARGGFPHRAGDLGGLPGVGSYTAAAVASICFGEAVPVLDGNVARLAARLLAEPGDFRLARVRRRLLAAAAALLDPSRPGDGNQAMMELGATVCRPRAPLCGACPLAAGCRGLASGAPELYPAAAVRRPVERVGGVAAVVESGGRFLLARRSRHGEPLAGLWEVPWVEAAAAAAAAALAARYGGRWRLAARVGEVRHGITFRALEIAVWRSELEAGEEVAEGVEARWFAAAELADRPLASLARKVLAAVGCGAASGRPSRVGGAREVSRPRRRGCTSR